MSNSDHHFSTTVVELEKREYRNPLVIGGFVGGSVAGVMAAGYIINALGLHQVAHLKSPHIPPVAVFVGGRLRHPFRIYANDMNDLLLLTCEVPIEQDGLYEVSSALMDWLSGVGAREIVILDGIPVRDIPEEHPIFGVADERAIGELSKRGIQIAQTALITGVGGSILSECMVRDVPGSSLLVPMSVAYPDPEGILSLIDSVNRVYGLSISTEALENDVKRMHQELKAIEKNYQEMVDRSRKQGEEGLYG
ncbi:proteasome assembly chaperone family protein [Thermogymnomonas acidicola]|uniref:Proteasome assembly chaperone family protein n=1 Tax=Thermogymnomonas acidicola TaxID=399579 RepID=A0AA37F9W5_9ARCH|nr:proteasome assembly chaperone family protein [Thermogymnomonas acidicola]GGM76385.1 proteasome assembly chaperone family protein [Thermogymnomonas acidicola]